MSEDRARPNLEGEDFACVEAYDLKSDGLMAMNFSRITQKAGLKLRQRTFTGDFRRYYLFGIFLSILTVTLLRFSAIGKNPFLLEIIREFYYVPLLLGAMSYGLKGAALTYLFILALYLPMFHEGWASVFGYGLDRSFHILLQGVIALFAGWLVDRDRKRRVEMERQQYLANIGQVATTIVHDLKNPIITVKGFARRISQGKGDARRSAKEIDGAADVMQQIVTNVLDFAKPLNLKRKEEDVRDVVNRAADLCRAKAEPKEVVLSVEHPAAPLNLTIDSLRMERAIVNVVSNAIEASSKGQVVTLRTDPGKNSVLIKITDQGSGIDEENLKNIFAPYFTTKASGTGLGLSIAQKIINGHCGKISLDSRRGSGTEVKIELPYRCSP
jgi:signal transduction histidine kinase